MKATIEANSKKEEKGILYALFFFFSAFKCEIDALHNHFISANVGFGSQIIDEIQRFSINSDADNRFLIFVRLESFFHALSPVLLYLFF